MSSFERIVEYAEYLIALGKQNPAALLSSPVTATNKGKSIHQKLLELYIEETAKQPDDKKLLCNTNLLFKLVQRDKLNCLVLNLYPGNEGYSLMLKSKAGVETETFKLPYECTEFLDYIDDSELPPFLVDVLDKAQVNVFYNGCVIVEVRDYRRSTSGSYDPQFVLLKPTSQSLLADINNLTNDGHVWTQEDVFQLESKLLLATEEPICLDPSPAVLLVANRQQFDRKKFNTPALKRAAKRYSQAAMNRKRKFAQSAAPSELQLHDFITKHKNKRVTSSTKLGRTSVDCWKQKPCFLSAPESVDVEKLARVIERPEKSLLQDNTLALIEEQILERDVTQDRKQLAKLSIFHRPGDDTFLGELYLDHDYIKDKSKGATCRFQLGTKDSVKKYLDQFREIFTEEGRRVVKITTQRPGQPPIVTCTQTATVAAASVSTLPIKQPVNVSAVQPLETVQGDGAALGLAQQGVMKRSMPLQLSLSIGPSGAATGPLSTTASQVHSANHVQLNIQSPAMNQSQLVTQRLQQQQQQPSNQAQSASQRLKQMGIHTNLPSRNNTPTASPVTSQPPGQQFGNPTSLNNPIQIPQQGLSKTPTHTPTPTPPPIVSPPSVPVQINRKPSLSSESSGTVHHMAQTPHQANVATFVQGDAAPSSSSSSHQQQGITNINIANIGIPPNINIQNLTGLPGMNITNLQGLQNMQVSLSVHGGGSIAVPISMITSHPVLQQGQGIIVTSGSALSANTQTVPSTTATSQQPAMVTMVTHLPTTASMSSSLSSASTSAAATTAISTHIITSVSSNLSNVLTAGPGGMLSLPIGNIGNITQLVPASLKSHGQLRGSSLPLFQLVNLPQQRASLKPGTTLQTGQTIAQIQGVKPTTSISGPLTTTLLQPSGSVGGQGGHHVQVSLAKSNTQGITTLTPQQVLQLPPHLQAQLQAFQQQQQQQQQQKAQLSQQQQPQQQQLQFHQILKPQSLTSQQALSLGGKPKPKKHGAPTPPK